MAFKTVHTLSVHVGGVVLPQDTKQHAVASITRRFHRYNPTVEWRMEVYQLVRTVRLSRLVMRGTPASLFDELLRHVQQIPVLHVNKYDWEDDKPTYDCLSVEQELQLACKRWPADTASYLVDYVVAEK